MTRLSTIMMGVMLATSSTCMGMSTPIERRDVGGSCSSDYDYLSLSCPVSRNNCLEGFNANAFYQNGDCNCVCIRDGRREAHTPSDSVAAQKPVKALAAPSRRDAGGSCSSDYNYFGFDCPVDSDNCDSGYHANAFYQNGICNCVCMQNGRREAHTEPKSALAKEAPVIGLPAPSRRDASGACSSDYNYFGFDCPVDSDNCDSGYQANAFYQNGICNCVCMQNGRREAQTTPKSVLAKEAPVIGLPGPSRRDNGGSCSSDYNYFGFDCPVDSDNCNSGYHANAFYQNGICNCVCMQNGRRESQSAPMSVSAQEAMRALPAPARRNASGSCSSDYNYFGFDCPVDSDNCGEGYHASAHYDYDHSECDCDCVQN